MSRKYRQTGYQDDRPRSARARAGAGGREPTEGPRGRGLGAPTATVFRCTLCGEQASAESIVPETVCSGCDGDLHSCTHCAHFDSSAALECRQPIVERVRGKAKRNRCELFAARQTQEFAREQERPTDGRAAFDDLFNF